MVHLMKEDHIAFTCTDVEDHDHVGNRRLCHSGRGYRSVELIHIGGIEPMTEITLSSLANPLAILAHRDPRVSLH